MLTAIIYQIQQLSPPAPPNTVNKLQRHFHFRPSCILGQQFLSDYFRFLYYTVRSEWPQPFQLKSNDGSYIQININLRDAFDNAIIHDYPLDQLFEHMENQNSTIIVDGNIFLISNETVGPNNLKYTNYTAKELTSNFRTAMVADMMIPDQKYYIHRAVKVKARLQTGIEVVQHIVKYDRSSVKERHIHLAIEYGNWDIAMYLVSVLGLPQTPYEGDINAKITLHGLQTINYIFPGQLSNIIRDTHPKCEHCSIHRCYVRRYR